MAIDTEHFGERYCSTSSRALGQLADSDSWVVMEGDKPVRVTTGKLDALHFISNHYGMPAKYNVEVLHGDGWKPTLFSGRIHIKAVPLFITNFRSPLKEFWELQRTVSEHGPLHYGFFHSLWNALCRAAMGEDGWTKEGLPLRFMDLWESITDKRQENEFLIQNKTHTLKLTRHHFKCDGC